MPEYDDDDLEYSSGTSIVAMVLPFATAIAALALGAVLGIGIGWVIKPAQRVEVPVPRDLTAAELAQACAPQINETVNELEKAQGKVKELQTEVDSRTARVQELEAQVAKKPKSGGGGGGSMARELAQAKADLAEAREQLVIAKEEKERLVVELTQTKEELAATQVALEVQVEKTEVAKEDALANKWYRFLNGGQLEVCEKGNRKKLGRCRETVEGALGSGTRRDRFAHCVRSGQARPSVHELEKKATLPDFAEMIDEEQKQTKGWYVLWCDPTLPEIEEGMPTDKLPG